MVEGVSKVGRKILLEFKRKLQRIISSSFSVPRNASGIWLAAKDLDGFDKDSTVETSSCVGIGLSYSLGES